MLILGGLFRVWCPVGLIDDYGWGFVDLASYFRDFGLLGSADGGPVFLHFVGHAGICIAQIVVGDGPGEGTGVGGLLTV